MIWVIVGYYGFVGVWEYLLFGWCCDMWVWGGNNKK